MQMARRNALVLALVALIVGVGAGLAAGRARWRRPAAAPVAQAVQSAVELQDFRNKYGPSHFTEREEEWFIRDYFQDRRGGVFVDVGANDYQKASKTYFLETRLGWSGLAIEPQREFAEGFAKHRPRTKFFPFFISDVSNETARLYVIKKWPEVSSANAEFVKKFGHPDEIREVPTVTLTDLLDAERVRNIDFMSIDIELHEPKALRGFAIDRYKPLLVCVEGLLPVRQEILNYFAEHKYVLVGKYMWADLENLYFAPLDKMRAPD
jgi:FkbM family methyltransferase